MAVPDRRSVLKARALSRLSNCALFLVPFALAAAAGIVYGGLPDRGQFGGTALGILLLAYSFVILFLRKGGFIGGR